MLLLIGVLDCEGIRFLMPLWMMKSSFGRLADFELRSLGNELCLFVMR